MKSRYSLLDVFLLSSLLAVLVIVFVQKLERQYMALVFQSPLPLARVASEESVSDEVAYKYKYQFTSDWFTHNIPVWEKVLAPFRNKPEVRYLEIGLYEGRSVIWVLENILTHPTSRATGIDVFQGSYKDRYFTNIERSGASDRLRTITAYSQVALREMPLESFDIIYIDGSHAKEDVLEDAVLSWRLLKVGGLLIFDDYHWAGFAASGTSDRPADFPKTAIDAFAQCFHDHVEVVHNSYQLILRKKS
jgi:predicted O-methyltransferase YrrM